MTDRPLNVTFETNGEWFLPEEPSRVIPGTLKYTPDLTELELHEAFRPVRGGYRVGDTQTYPLIYGSTTVGELATLFDAQRAGFNLNFGSAGMRGPERVISTLLVVGAHLPADFAYPEMSFRVPGLEVWLSRQVVEQQLPERGPGG